MQHARVVSQDKCCFNCTFLKCQGREDTPILGNFTICRRWLLGITEYGIESVYNDLVMAYAYCDTVL